MLTAKARRFRLKDSMQRSLSLCFIRNETGLLIVIIAYSGISDIIHKVGYRPV